MSAWVSLTVEHEKYFLKTVKFHKAMLSLFHKLSKTTENFLPGFLPSKKGRQVDHRWLRILYITNTTLSGYTWISLTNFDKKKLSGSIRWTANLWSISYNIVKEKFKPGNTQSNDNNYEFFKRKIFEKN